MLLGRGAGRWHPSPAAGHGLLGRGVDRASAAQSAYPGALCLDGLDVQAVLHGLASAAGLGVVLGAPAGLGAGLAVPILPEQGGAELHIVALLLGDVSVRAVHRLHVLPEGAGVRVPLGAAWDLADVGFLGREGASRTRQEGRPRRGARRRPDAGPSAELAAPPSGGAGPLDGAALHRPRLPPFLEGKHVVNETLSPTSPDWRHGSEPVEGGSSVRDQLSHQHVGSFSISECITSLHISETALNTLLSLMRKEVQRRKDSGSKSPRSGTETRGF